MHSPHRIVIRNPEDAEKAKDYIKIGRHFLFIEDQIALKAGHRAQRRLERLLIRQSRQVIPLVGKPVSLNGLDIEPSPTSLGRMACLVSDRDLYRSNTDNVRLFMAVPGPATSARLVVHHHGEHLLDRPVTLENAMAVETLAGLPPGRYTARLFIGPLPAAGPVAFTVADYSLAPLSARLLDHSLDRKNNQLTFRLSVESFNLPYDGDIRVELVERNRVVEEAIGLFRKPGLYEGKTRLAGSGPFRLRVTSADHPDRVAEAALPGAREAERSATVISEFGREVFFSLMPEPGALPVRGGYLTEGESLPTGLLVPEVLTDRPRIRASADVSSLVLIIADFLNQVHRVQTVGDLAAGSEVAVDSDGPVNTVFAGCLVGGRPFEGYTTFIRPSRLQLSLNVPETMRPREQLTLSLTCEGAKGPVPVLLSVRDERLTAADTPQTGLAGSVKRCLDEVLAGMEESSIQPAGPLVDKAMPQRYNGALWAAETSSGPDASPYPEMAAGPYESMPMMRPMTRPRMRSMTSRAPATRQDIMVTSPDPPSAPVEPARSEFPEVLFYGLVTVEGSKSITLPLQDTLGGFAVEAFALHQGDWTQQQSRFLVDQPVRIDLQLPQAVFAGDTVTGRLRAASPSGRARIALYRDGEPVRLRTRGPDGAILLRTETAETPVELDFDVRPGAYRAEVEDPAGEESDAVEASVETPGKIIGYAKAIHLLSAGETLDRSAPETVSLRLLPALEEPFQLLAKATAGYGHLCCEQTAAKILGAVVMYLSAGKEAEQQAAEQIILAGIEREKKMFHPGKGFAMYPDRPTFSHHYGPMTARYLWNLRYMGDLDKLSPMLKKGFREAIKMADEAGKAYEMEPIPQSIRSFQDAYAVVASKKIKGDTFQEVLGFIEDHIDFNGDSPKLIEKNDAVGNRAGMAYAAAVLLAAGDLRRGLRLANPVVKQFNEQGRLYSTIDSVAAIALMVQLRKSGVVSGKGRVAVNGKEMDISEASGMAEAAESVRGIEGVAVVEEIRRTEEDWNGFGTPFPVRVDFLNSEGKAKTEFKAGDAAELRVSLPDGYENGDLLHVCLPPAMCWIEGGAKVQQFSLDFEGRNELRIPVAVTEEIRNPQHFAVCVRNMFQEERAAGPGILVVPPKPSLKDKVRKLAGLSG